MHSVNHSSMDATVHYRHGVPKKKDMILDRATAERFNLWV
jgi:hypothetical protein